MAKQSTWRTKNARLACPTEYFHSSGATSLSIVVRGSNAVGSFVMRSIIPGTVFVPPDDTTGVPGYVHGGTAVAQTRPEDPDLCIGRPIAFQSPSIHGKDRPKPLEISMGESRWCAVGHSERNSHEPLMMSKEFTKFKIRATCPRNRESLPNIDPKFTAGQWLEQFKFGSTRVRFETCWNKSDDSTPTHIRTIQGRCSRAIASPEFRKNKIQTPHGWTYAVYHSSFQQYLDKILLIGLIARAIGKKGDKYVTSRPHLTCSSVELLPFGRK